jgi:ketose-bisphosphate aldolase
MSIRTAKELLVEATEGGYAVGAFNVTSLIQMEAVVEAHVDHKAPLIIQTSVAPSKFLGREMIVAIFRTLANSSPIPMALHLDHCQDVVYCKQCAEAGYTNIMIDASRQDFEENIRQTKEVTEYCHQLGTVSVEGELGMISGAEDQVKVAKDEALLCNPQQAVEFVERTGVDLLAPAVGTVHGVYKATSPKVDFERFGKIFQLVNAQGVRAPLVIHGGTGLSPEYVRKLISLGGAKFNVSTDLKRTLIDTTYAYISQNRDEYIPGKIDAAVKDAIRDKVAYWIGMLGSAGKA